MNSEIKTKWVEALRSGEYQQGFAALCHNGTYCCLGVLVDIAAPEEWLQGKQYIKENKDNFLAGTLSTKLLKRFGLTTAEQGILTNKNDSGNDFYTIADYIEKNL